MFLNINNLLIFFQIKEIFSEAVTSKQQLKDTSPKVHKKITLHENLLSNISNLLLSKKHSYVGELILNSTQSNMKRCELLNDPEADAEKNIVLSLTPETFTIRDYGCGMSDQDIERYLLQIGNTGGNSKSKQFGWGFFSVFSEVDLVTVKTKPIGSKDSYYEVIIDKKSLDFQILKKKDSEFEEGTEITLHLKKEIEQKEIEKFLKENVLESKRKFKILLKKNEKEIKEEKEKLKKKLEKRISEVESKRDETLKKIQEKADSETKDADKDKKEEDNEETVDEKIEEKDEEIKEKNDEENIDILNEKINSLKEELENIDLQIEKTKELQLCPWDDIEDLDTLKKIYASRYNRRDLQVAKIFKFTIPQEGSRIIDANFTAMVFIPRPDNNNLMFGQDDKKVKGKFEVFVQDLKISMDNVKIPSFLKGFYFIIKSDNANVLSTREAFSENSATFEKLTNALTRKIVEEFCRMEPEEIHQFQMTIKNAYLETLKKKNTPLNKTLSKVLTFKTNKDYYTYINKDTNEDEETVNEEDEENKEEVKKVNKKKKSSNVFKLNDFYSMVEDFNKENSQSVKAIYYTVIPESYVKDIKNPIIDGINVPFLFADNFLDEQAICSLQNYESLKIKNLINETFENKKITKENQTEFKEVIERFKKVLSAEVDQVILSKRLVDCPLYIRAKGNLSKTHKNIMGESLFEKNPMRSHYDPKGTLEINHEAEEIIGLKEMIQFNNENVDNAIYNMYVAACLVTGTEVYNKINAYTNLMNISSRLLELKKTYAKNNESEQEDNEQMDFAKMMAQMTSGMQGFQDQFKDLEGAGDMDDMGNFDFEKMAEKMKDLEKMKDMFGEKNMNKENDEQIDEGEEVAQDEGEQEEAAEEEEDIVEEEEMVEEEEVTEEATEAAAERDEL